MAELVIFKGPHWMDALPSTEVDKFDAIKKGHYEGRYQLGDIVDTFEDGRFSDAAALKGKFYYVKVVGMSKADARAYEEIPKRNYNSEELAFYGAKMDAKIAKLQETEIVANPAELKAELMATIIADKPRAYRRKYALDFTKLKVDDLKAFTDGKFLEISEQRFTELLKDKTV